MRQSQINYKYNILKASGNFRSNKLKFQKEEKLFFFEQGFFSFPCRHFLIPGAYGGSGLETLGPETAGPQLGSPGSLVSAVPPSHLERATSLSLFTFMYWRGKWQPTPVFLPGESQGWRSLVGFCLWGRTESDTTDAT